MTDGGIIPTGTPAPTLDGYVETALALEAAIGTRIVGYQNVIRQVVIGLLTEGHVLLEGLPGLGKTELLKTLSTSLQLSFGRIQFTPDLMPADIIGTQVLEEGEDGRRHFEYRAGPLFANLVLADEINRATPKTQSALLEAMQERAVTVAGETRPLPRPFLVMATQNPIELEGTYPLPEAQLDRFMFKVRLRPPSQQLLQEILKRTTTDTRAEIPEVATVDQVQKMIAFTPTVPIASHLLEYVAALVAATHPRAEGAIEPVTRFVRHGASPRGGQSIVMGAKARALLEGRPHVNGDDIRWCAVAALRHRLVMGYEATAEDITSDHVLVEVVRTVPEPKAPQRGAP